MESALFVEGDLDRSSAILLASKGVALWVISSSFSGKFSTPFSVSSNSGSPVNNVHYEKKSTKLVSFGFN